MNCLLIAASFILAAEPYHAYVLNTEPPIWSVAAQDVTGDGKAELFEACCDEQSYPLKKSVAVFIADGEGGYPAKPSLTIDVPASMSTFFFAEVDGKAPKELVGVDAEGATVFQYVDGKFTASASPRFMSLLPSGAKQPFFLKNAAEDLDGDGIDEWILPIPAGYEIRKPDQSLARITCDVASDINDFDGVYISHRLPSCHPFTLPSETQKSLVFLSDEFADFASGKSWADSHRFKIPLNLADKWQATTRTADINADGLPDLVVTQMKGTVNLKAVTHVYLSNGPFSYPSAPSATFEADGAVSSPAVIDVDGDGKQDLVFMSVPFGVKNIVNYFVRRKIAARIEVYLFKDGAFPKEPTFSESALLDAPEGRERIAYALGDFNGDGRMDAAFGQSTDAMVIRTGNSEQFASSKPWVTLALPSFGTCDAVDLNGNKAKDLVLYHPSGKNKTRLDVVVF